MNTNPPTLKPWTPLDEAIETISNCRYRGLPVTDNNNKLMGLISEDGLLALFEDIDEAEHLTGEFIQPVKVCFSPDDNLIDICQQLLSQEASLIPIVSDEWKLLGVITPKELLRYTLNYQRFFSQLPKNPQELLHT